MSGGLRKVLLSPEVLTGFLTEGASHRAVRVARGLPPGARLVAVEVPPRPFVYGADRHVLVAVFEHEAWAETADGTVPEVSLRFEHVLAVEPAVH